MAVVHEGQGRMSSSCDSSLSGACWEAKTPRGGRQNGRGVIQDWRSAEDCSEADMGQPSGDSGGQNRCSNAVNKARRKKLCLIGIGLVVLTLVFQNVLWELPEDYGMFRRALQWSYDVTHGLQKLTEVNEEVQLAGDVLRIQSAIHLTPVSQQTPALEH
ncbi:hypothetical protein E2C01_000007 [Portunus trituberculatus]|uniref:Uncharacterized protein n=1 Tax=Portunus trituberculatus TaxID=210409 RepID=A0A5B7CDQ5_PORTR|nr:hypothetical protein [Portunus trituberculatus]